MPVSCAIIYKDGLVLAAQRSATMSLPLKWEFPGGKVEPGETPEGCIHREIAEELGITIRIVRRLAHFDHAQGSRIIRLIPFVCEYEGGEIGLAEHAQVRWCTAEELPQLDWGAGDLGVLGMV